MDRVCRNTEPVIGHDHDRRLLANTGTVESGQHTRHLRVEKGHARLRRRRAGSVVMIDAVERQQVKEKEIRLVPLDDVHRRVGPALIPPGA
jgi:hypothetical protein